MTSIVCDKVARSVVDTSSCCLEYEGLSRSLDVALSFVGKLADLSLAEISREIKEFEELLNVGMFSVSNIYNDLKVPDLKYGDDNTGHKERFHKWLLNYLPGEGPFASTLPGIERCISTPESDVVPPMKPGLAKPGKIMRVNASNLQVLGTNKVDNVINKSPKKYHISISPSDPETHHVTYNANDIINVAGGDLLRYVQRPVPFPSVNNLDSDNNMFSSGGPAFDDPFCIGNYVITRNGTSSIRSRITLSPKVIIEGSGRPRSVVSNISLRTETTNRAGQTAHVSKISGHESNSALSKRVTDIPENVNTFKIPSPTKPRNPENFGLSVTEKDNMLGFSQRFNDPIKWARSMKKSKVDSIR